MTKVGPEYLQSKSKRSLDVLGSVALGLAMLPATAATYTAAAIDNRSLSPMFIHERVGFNGMRFPMFKFKTLRSGLLMSPEESGWAYDSRASSVGQLLRRFGLDEIPQIRNVLQGDMALVGIRPPSEENLNYWREISPNNFDEWYEAFSLARPGLIGPGQIFRHQIKNPVEQDYETSLQIEIDYVKKASLINDLRILGSAPLKLLAANLRPVESEITIPETIAA